jgi:hypothetical protein
LTAKSFLVTHLEPIYCKQNESWLKVNGCL